MAKNYEKGDKYYLPVVVDEIVCGDNYPVKLTFLDGGGGDSVGIADEPGLLLTAEDIAMVINTERDDALAELKSRNAELEALLKEVMATRDEAIQQNNELIAENDRLKTDVADLSAELESAREAVEQNGKDRDFYHARFDEAAENLHKALTENAELKSRNEHLETLLKTKPIEEATRTVHAVLNDGTGYNLFKCTKASFDNYADFSVLKIYRGEEYVAGFLRGDKPGNLAYWWTE